MASIIDPHTAFFGDSVNLNCQMEDILLFLDKIEDIDFNDSSTDNNCNGFIDDIWPDVARYSFIILLVRLLENELRRFCNSLKEYENLSIKWNELRGNFFHRAICYCEKIVNLKICHEEEIVQKIRGIIELRNCIVHNDASLAGC